ncbi:hypothetical protein V1522DRAFT_123332 [Lipomyces starkeyi]
MEVQESKTVSDALQSKITTLEAEISTLKETIDAKTKDIEVKDQALEEFKTAAARAMIPGPAEDGPVAVVPSTGAAWEEQQKRLEELQATLEKKQADLSEATKVNAARTAEAVKLKEELERKQTELEQMKIAATESANALSKSDATASSGNASEELQKKLADLRTELETRHKTELEEALKAKVAEMEAQKAEAVNKAREISQKESTMRNKLLQQKADKADKDKIEALRQLAMLRGEAVAPSAVSQRRVPLPPQTPTPGQGSPTSQQSTPSHQATAVDTPQPQTLGLQVTGASQSAQSAASPSGPRQLQPPQVPAPSQQSQGSQQVSASIPVRSMVKPVIGQQPQSRSQSQLPQLQRPGLQPLRGLGSQQAAGGPSPLTLSNPMQAQVLQHLQPGPRRSASQLVRPGVGLPVQGQAGAANVNRPSHIPHPPPAGGGIKIAGTAASTPPPEPSPESTAGIKRSREEDAVATTGGDATGSAGDGQAAAGEMATGPPVALKRRREETQ